MWVTCSSQLFDGWPVFVLFFGGRLLVVMLIGWRAATNHVLSLLVGEGQYPLLQLSLQFSGFRVKARHLGHRFEGSVCIKYPNVLYF